MKIELNLETIIGGVLEETAAQLKSEIVLAQVIPKDSGDLQTSHHVVHPEERVAGIATDIAYARRLYHHPEYNFRKGENSKNAKGKWFEDWESGGKYEGRAAEIYAEKLRNKLGGG